MALCSFSQHVDSIAGNHSRLAIGLSSLDGNRWDGSLKILSRESGKEIAFRPSPCGITMVRFTGDGDPYLLATRDDGNVAMYAVETLEELREFAAHDDIASAVSNDKHKEGNFATVGWEGDLCLWDWKSESTALGPFFAVRGAHSGAIYDVQHNPVNSSHLCTVGRDGFARMWDSRAGKECVQLVDLGAPGSCLVWEIDARGGDGGENKIIAGNDIGELISIDCRKGEIESRLDAHRARVRRILCPPSPHAATKQQSVIMSVSDDTSVAIWKNDGSATGYSEFNRFKPHTDYISDAAWLQGSKSDNGDDVLFTSSTDKTVCRSSIPKIL